MGGVWLCSDSVGVLFSDSVGVLFSAGGSYEANYESSTISSASGIAIPILVVVRNIIHSSCDNLVGSH